jgi:RNA polymerase sigma factor (sigma-70 family)
LFLKLKRNRSPVPGIREEKDEALVILYRRTKDLDIIGQLFERYTHLVYGVCLKYLKDDQQCKDAVMEIFEELFVKLADHEVHNFKSWLYSVARNYCLMEIRKQGTLGRLKEKLPEDFRTGDMEFETVMHLIDGDEKAIPDEVLLKAFESLVPGQAECVRMMYLDHKSYKEITIETGYSMNEVKSHIQNGKRNLKNYILGLHGSKK